MTAFLVNGRSPSTALSGSTPPKETVDLRISKMLSGPLCARGGHCMGAALKNCLLNPNTPDGNSIPADAARPVYRRDQRVIYSGAQWSVIFEAGGFAPATGKAERPALCRPFSHGRNIVNFACSGAIFGSERNKSSLEGTQNERQSRKFDAHI